MAYAQSHKIEYKDYADIDTRIEIWTDGYSGSIEECESGDDPLNVDIASFSPTIFMAVIGTGATIKLNSATGGQFMGLYTINPVKRMIKIFKNNHAYPWWLGYINPEQYGEGYSRAQDYPVTINCNDGFNALTRFKYLDGSGNNYTSLESYWNILTRIITKMGLPFQYLYFATKLTSDDVTIGSSETLFHQLKTDQNNYYDEQNLPKTFRDVLEALLSCGLQIRWNNGSIFIYEPQMLADSSFSAKRFNSSFTYVDTVSLDPNLDISNDDINWDNEDQALDTLAGNSKQVIRFSPYGHDHAVPVIDLTDQSNWTGTPVWTETHKSGGGASIYYLSGITALGGFTLGSGAILGGKRTDLNTDPEIYIEGDYGYWVGNEFFKNTTANVWLSGVRGSSVLFKGKVFLRSKQWENDGLAHVGISAQSLIFKISIEIGDKRPHAENPRADYQWITSTTDFFYIKAHNSGSPIDDQWIDFQFQLPWNFPAGEMVITIYDDFKAYDDIVKWIDDTPLGIGGSTWAKVRFKDIEFQVIDVTDPVDGGRIGYKFTSAVLDDKKFTGTINEQFLNEGQEITLIQADGVNCADRGAIRKADNSYTTLWRKTGDSTSFLLPILLLRSIISQYQESLIQLSGTIEADALMDSNGGPSFLFTLQDSDYLSTRKLMFAGGTYNDFKRTLNGSFLEVKQEDLTINVE